MEQLSSAALAKLLKREFPVDATCWGQATDEVRDMCRNARMLAGQDESVAVDFRVITSPSQWNTEGIDGIIRFYEMLNEEKQREFCEQWLPGWLKPEDTIQ